MIFRKNKNKIGRKERVEIFKGTKKKFFGFAFERPIAKLKNIPGKYANEIYGRPKKKFFIPFWKIFIIILVLSTLVWVALFSDIFKIKRVIVVNNQILLEGDIEKFLEETNIKNKNFFLLNTNQVRDILKEYYKRIEDARVFRVFPNKIKIKISEKPSTIIWQVNESRFLLDNNGFAIAEVYEEMGMPVVIDHSGLAIGVGDRVVIKSFIDFVNTADESLRKRFGLGVVAYSINQTTFELKAHINSGFYILFDTMRDIVEQLDKLERVYQQGEVMYEYVILSVDGRVIVK